MSSPSLDQHIIQFNNLLVEILSHLKTTYPKLKKQIKQCYRYYKGQEPLTYIRTWLDESHTWRDYVGRCDESLFYLDNQDQSDNSTTYMWLPGLNFKQVWKAIETSESVSPEQKEQSKNCLFDNLQKLLIISFHIIRENDQWSKKLARQQVYIDQLKRSLQVKNLIAREITQESGQEDQESSEGPASNFLEVVKSFSFLDDIFKQKNVILDIAIDIAHELQGALAPCIGDMSQGVNNPMDVVKKMISSGEMERIKQLVMDKIEVKMKQSGISEEDLVNQFKSLSNLPGLKNIQQLSASIVQKLGQQGEASPDTIYQDAFDILKNDLEQGEFILTDDLQQLLNRLIN